MTDRIVERYSVNFPAGAPEWARAVERAINYVLARISAELVIRRINSSDLSTAETTPYKLAIVPDAPGGTSLAFFDSAVPAWKNVQNFRSIVGTTSRITVTNGDGVAGSPTINISTSYAGQNTITTVGTVTTGVWNAGAVTSSGNVSGVDLLASNSVVTPFVSATNVSSSNTVSALYYYINGAQTLYQIGSGTYLAGVAANSYLYIGHSGDSRIRYFSSSHEFFNSAGTALLFQTTITGIGFYGAAPASKPNVTGSRGGNAALASLLTGLAGLGLITNSTTA